MHKLAPAPTAWPYALAAMTAALLASLLLITLPQAGAATPPAANASTTTLLAQCGGPGQRACKVWERIPSCNKNLMEVSGKCERCGGPRQRACPVTVRVPSCNKHLIETRGRCEPCGALNQRACPVTVRVPSCNQGLVEELGTARCVKPKARPAHCGRVGQKPCKIHEFIPSCTADAVEDFVKGQCINSSDGLLEKAKVELQKAEPTLTRIANSAVTCIDPTLLARTAPGARQGVVDNLLKLECFRSILATARAEGFKTVSVGLSGGTSIGFGIDVEAGFAFDTAAPTNAPTFYLGGGYSLGMQGDASGSVAISLLKGANRTGGGGYGGDSHGLTLGLAAAGGSGVGVWFSYEGALDGLTVMLTSGAKLNAGSYSRSTTHVFALTEQASAPRQAVVAVPANGLYVLDTGGFWRVTTQSADQFTISISGTRVAETFTRKDGQSFVSQRSGSTLTNTPSGRMVYQQTDGVRLVIQPKMTKGMQNTFQEPFGNWEHRPTGLVFALERESTNWITLTYPNGTTSLTFYRAAGNRFVEKNGGAALTRASLSAPWVLDYFDGKPWPLHYKR